MAEESRESDPRATSSHLPGAEDLLEGWPKAAPFFLRVEQAARLLAESETRGISRLGKRVARYIRFNRTRLAHLFEGMEGRSWSVLSTILYLLQVNETELPGYTRSRVPLHGIRQFDFNETIQKAIEGGLNRLGTRPPPTEFRPVIRSVFVSSDIGTLSQRPGDSVTIFVVGDLRAIGDAVLRQFQTRLDHIADWAESQGLLVHFELVDPVWSSDGDFGNLRGEPARGVLLKERFFRHGIYLAGELPVFWCTTPGSGPEKHGKTAVLADRMDFDEALSFVDLGYIELPSVRVRRRAMLALVNHHPISPMCSLLEMILLVHGANASTALAEHLKSRIFRGAEAVHFMDPYIMLFDAASVALAYHGKWEQLNALRRLFVLKLGIMAQRTRRGRRNFLKSFRAAAGYFLRWGWDEESLIDAERHARANAEDMDALDSEFRSLYLGLYQEISSLAASQPGRFDESEISLLGRRLLACFGRAGGQVSPSYPYLLHEERSQERFYVYDDPEAAQRDRWKVYQELERRQPPPGVPPIYSADSLPKVLAWAGVNTLIRPSTEVRVISSDSLVTTAILTECMSEVEDAISLVDPLTIGSQNFGKTRRIERALLFVNFDQKRGDEKQIERDRRQYLPSNWDVLNYGRNQGSRVRDLAVVTRDSWDQVHCRRTRGSDAVRTAMRMIFQGRTVDSVQNSPLSVVVPEGRTQRAVRDRLQQLIQSVHDIAAQPVRDDGFRAFVYQVGGGFQVVRRLAKGLHLINLKSFDGVVRLVSASHLENQGVVYDGLAPAFSDLRALSKRVETDRDLEFAIGWRMQQGEGHLILVDQSGRIYRRKIVDKNMDQHVVRIVRRILHTIRHRVRDMRTLRKVVRIFELRDGESQGDQSHLYEDTVRILRVLGDPRPSRPEVYLKGDFSYGRNGLYFEYKDERFSPAESGRRFALELVEKMLSDRQEYSQFDLHIEAAHVQFPDNPSSRSVVSVSRQLRVIDLYERLLARALLSLKGQTKQYLSSLNTFRRDGG